MRVRSSLALGLPLALVVACSGREDETAIARARLSAGCVINSDCVDGLVCAYGRCHVACVTARDCPGGRCVAGPASVREAGVCQLDDERACVRNSDCPGPQLCGPDDVCRDACAADRDCRDGEVCAAGSCASVAEVASGALAPKSDAACRYASDCPGDLVCLRGRCDVECVGAKDCRVSWSCGGDTRCHPPGWVAPLARCVPIEAGATEEVATLVSSASGGGPSSVANEAEMVDEFQCVIRGDGQALCRGDNGYGRLGTGSGVPTTSADYLPLAIDEPVTTLALGGVSGCALGASGAAYCWGSNQWGATGTGPQGVDVPPSRVRLDAGTLLPPVLALRPAYDGFCAITHDAKLYCWGYTRLIYLQPEYGGDERFFYASIARAVSGIEVADLGIFGQGFCVLTRQGEVDCAGSRADHVIADGQSADPQYTPSKILGLDGHAPVRGIAIGFSHACALGADGKVLCWGGKVEAEAGVDPGGDTTMPVVVRGLDDVRKIATSDRSNFTCAVRGNGEVACWGLNLHAELGTPYAQKSLSALPLTVPKVAGAIDVSVGSDQACALLGDGRTVCWGFDGPPTFAGVPCPPQ